MNAKKEIKAIEIFAGTIMEAQLVKSLLENAEIEAFLKDDITGTLTPWIISPGGSDPVKIVISSPNYDKAMLVIDEYEKTR